jgi:hypothetical protein
MIDWLALSMGALWVLGLCLVFAALSIKYYLADGYKGINDQNPEKPFVGWMIDLGLFLFCVGRAGGYTSIWELIVWGVLGLFFVLRTWQDVRIRRT